MATPQVQRSVPEVLQDIVRNVQEIIRSEFLLAKTEIKEEAQDAAKPAATFGAGLALGFYGIGFLLLAAVYGLSTVMAEWLAALIVGAVLSAIALTLVTSGSKRLKGVKKRPEKTIQSLEENVQWAKHPTK